MVKRAPVVILAAWLLAFGVAGVGPAATKRAVKPKPAAVAKAKASPSPIHDAVAKWDVAKVRELLNADPKLVKAVDGDGRTPLHIAAFWGCKDLVELLLSKGADVSAKAKNGRTALHEASGSGQRDAAELLLAKGADVNARDGAGKTPLHLAVAKGRIEVASLLLAKGADVNSKDSDGETPLVAAVYNDDREMARLLVGKGAEVNLKGRKGEGSLADRIEKLVEVPEEDRVKSLPVQTPAAAQPAAPQPANAGVVVAPQPANTGVAAVSQPASSPSRTRPGSAVPRYERNENYGRSSRNAGNRGPVYLPRGAHSGPRQSVPGMNRRNTPRYIGPPGPVGWGNSNRPRRRH